MSIVLEKHEFGGDFEEFCSNGNFVIMTFVLDKFYVYFSWIELNIFSSSHSTGYFRPEPSQTPSNGSVVTPKIRKHS